MNKINVIDLDKTLIPYDSFRVLIKSELKRLNIHFWGLTILRVVRVIDAPRYKEKMVKCLEASRYEKKIRYFAQQIYHHIDEKVMSTIEKETDLTTTNVLISASPHAYVGLLVNKLNWQGSGSYVDIDGQFVHLYGTNKVKWLKKNFSQEKFNYNFAISDSSTDDELLRMFKKGVKWKI